MARISHEFDKRLNDHSMVRLPYSPPTVSLVLHHRETRSMMTAGMDNAQDPSDNLS